MFRRIIKSKLEKSLNNMYIYIDISRWIHNTPRIEVYIHIRVYIYISFRVSQCRMVEGFEHNACRHDC